MPFEPSFDESYFSIDWRIAGYLADDVGHIIKVLFDFDDREEAEDKYEELLSQLHVVNEHVVLYRLKKGAKGHFGKAYSQIYQDAYKCDILGPEGLVHTKNAYHTWQEALQERERTSRTRRTAYQRSKERREPGPIKMENEYLKSKKLRGEH